jgi:hypothetical protein
MVASIWGQKPAGLKIDFGIVLIMLFAVAGMVLAWSWRPNFSRCEPDATCGARVGGAPSVIPRSPSGPPQ